MDKTTIKSSKIIPKVQSSKKKADLELELDDVRNREGAINSQEVITKNKIKEMKERVIQELFTILKDFGVDPSNLESINSFLSKLEQENPDLLKLFELTFNELISEPEQAPQQPSQLPNVNQGLTPQPPQQPIQAGGLMDKYKNLAPEVMMPK